MSIVKRKKEIFKEKTFIIFLTICFLFLIFFYDYDFENHLFNSICVFIFGYLFYGVFKYDQFYIETGIKVNIANLKEYKAYRESHPIARWYSNIVTYIVMFTMVSSAMFFFKWLYDIFVYYIK